MEIQSINEYQNLSSQGVVLVDFHAKWCGPCRMLGPVLEELEQELQDQVKILKVDIDNLPELARDFGIQSIPTMIFLKGGQSVTKLTGFRPKAEIIATLETLKD